MSVLSNEVGFSIERKRVIIYSVEVRFQTCISSIVVAFQSFQNGLQAHANRNVVAVRWIDLKIDIVNEDAERRIFCGPFAYLAD